MPWHIVEHSSQCPADKPHAVIQDSNGHLMGCHPSTDAAKKQLAALYVHENQDGGQRAQPPAPEPVGPIEYRAAAVEAVNMEQRIITVCAVPYEEPARVEYRGQFWNEVFTRGAFDNLAGFAGGGNSRRIPVTVVLQPNPEGGHGGGHLVGKVANAFPDREDGLMLDLKVSKTDRGDETLELAHDDALSPSVGFGIRGKGQALYPATMTRRINRAFLDHLSMVAVPAYTGARILAMRAAAPGNPPPATPGLDALIGDPILNWATTRLQQTSADPQG